MLSWRLAAPDAPTVLGQLRAAYGAALLILILASTPEEAAQAMAAGASAWLLAPVRRITLVDVVRRLLPAGGGCDTAFPGPWLAP